MTQTTDACIICDEPTAATTQGQLGGRTGPMCEDCTFWCDGNVVES